MKFRTKLLYGFTINILLLIIVGIINTTFILNSQKDLNKLADIIFIGDKHIDRTNLLINQIHGDILSLLLNPDEEINIAKIDFMAEDFYSELDSIGNIFPDDIESFKVIRELFQEFYLYGKWIDSLPGLVSLEENPDAIRKFLEQKNNLIIEIDRSFVKYEELFVENFDKFNRQVSYILSASIIVVTLGVLFSILSSILIAESLSKPVRKLIDALKELETGNLKTNLEINSGDEIGLLAKALNSMSLKLDYSFNKLKENKDDLQYLQSLLQSILDSVRYIVIAVDNDKKVTHWNKSAEKLTGINLRNAEGKDLLSTFPGHILESAVLESLLKEHNQRDYLKIKREINREIRYLNLYVFPHINQSIEGAVILIEDITESVHMEELMIQSEKMLSVGGLAAGMAHEINNPLAGMIQTAGVMANRLGIKKHLPANIQAAEAAGTTIESIESYMESRGIIRMSESIKESGMRVAEIVENMLSFSRKSDHRKSSQSIEEILNQSLDLAGTDYKLKEQYDFKQIEIIKEFEQDLPLIPCERSKIQQVLFNILSNGAQAMQSSNTVNPHFILRTGFAEKKSMISIEIEDNGPGMDENIRKRVFEPFFTTKSIGSGTGLGLSVSYFIITENHKGKMFVESSKGTGTKFVIMLPL